MKKSAMIIINPTAGKEKGADYENLIREQLEEIYGELTIKITEGEGDATKFAKEATNEGYDLVVSLGGDGTVNEVVNGLASFENPPMLGIIPMGTGNVLARALNIPMKPERAIELLKIGHYTEIDIGLANEKYFTNILAIGNAAKAVHDVDIEDKTKFGLFSYIKAVAKEMIKDDVFSVKIEMDEQTWEGDVSVIILGLLDSLAGLKTIVSSENVSDGLIHVIAIKSLNLTELITMTPSLFFGSFENSDNIEYFKTINLKINQLDNRKFESNIDGDEGPSLPLNINILPKHLKVISTK